MTDAAEKDFLTKANLIADKYKMTLDIDFYRRAINFIGEYDQETELRCADELDKVLGRKSSFKTQTNFWSIK